MGGGNSRFEHGQLQFFEHGSDEAVIDLELQLSLALLDLSFGQSHALLGDCNTLVAFAASFNGMEIARGVLRLPVAAEQGPGSRLNFDRR